MPEQGRGGVMPPHIRAAGGRPPVCTQRHKLEPRDRAWAALAERDGGPVTAAELAELASVTRGGAATFLAEWVAAGLVDRGPMPAGRYAPYAVPHVARL